MKNISRFYLRLQKRARMYGCMKKTTTLLKQLRKLANIKPSSSLVVNFFLNFENLEGSVGNKFDRMVELKTKEIPKSLRENYEEITSQISKNLEDTSFGSAKSIAIFARGGEDAFFEVCPLNDIVETQLIVDLFPHLYPLVAANDRLDRYVIVTLTREAAQIYETNAGEIINEVSTENPELRERSGREWTREHYRNHRRDRNDRFVHQKLEIVNQLMSQKGYNHLLVAGSPKMVSRFINKLPTSLQNKVVDTLDTNPAIGKQLILAEALKHFVKLENLESEKQVELLKSELLRDGLAVSGYEDSLDAVKGGYADTLIISEGFFPHSKREAILRDALQMGIQIETLQDPKSLKDLSGIGCLLRYKPNFSSLKQISHTAS